MNIVLLCV